MPGSAESSEEVTSKFDLDDEVSFQLPGSTQPQIPAASVCPTIQLPRAVKLNAKPSLRDRLASSVTEVTNNRGLIESICGQIIVEGTPLHDRIEKKASTPAGATAKLISVDPGKKAWLMSWRPARAVGDPEECGADEMKREWEREGTMLTKLIPIMFEITSELEKRKGKHPPTDELADDELAYQCLSWVVGEYIERHGTNLGEESEAIQNWIIGGFDQWVLFFRESGLETAVNENQLSRMFCHVNTHVLVRQDAPQEPRTPEQATTTMPAVTPEKLDLRALIDIPREPEGLTDVDGTGRGTDGGGSV